MTWVLKCECGGEVSGTSRDELVAATERHIYDQHPSVLAFPPRTDVMAMAEEVEDDA